MHCSQLDFNRIASGMHVFEPKCALSCEAFNKELHNKELHKQEQTEELKHHQNVETRFCCPQASLSLYFCRDDVSE